MKYCVTVGGSREGGGEKMKKKEKKKGQYVIHEDAEVRIKDMDGIYELMYIPVRNTVARIVKIDKDHYVDCNSGEIKKFNHKEKRVDNINSLKRSMKKLRDLINANFRGGKNEGFWTFTYAENMTNSEQLYNDFKKFWQKFKRWALKNLGTDKFEYINVVEPQGRGAWHCHVLVKCEELERLFVPNEVLANLWGHGFVKIKGLTEVDNVGAYLSAYFADIEFSEEERQAVGVDTREMCKMASEGFELVERVVDGQKKKFIKGGRLHLYPTGMKFYRSTRGIKKPTTEWATKAEFKEKVGDLDPYFSKSYEFKYITPSQTVRKQVVVFEQYNARKS